MADPLQQYLDSKPLPTPIKADVWDAYHSAQNPSDFQGHFDKLKLPDSVKADLWDLKFQGKVSTPAPPKPIASPPETGWGSHIPDMAVGPMKWFQSHINDPLDRMAQKGGEIGAKVFEQGTAAIPSGGVGGFPHLYDQDQYEKDHQFVSGVAKGVGRTVGSTVSDPRNWPFMGSGTARPMLQKLITSGFAAQMGKGTVDIALHLHQDWDSLTPSERAELGTQGVLSAAMTTMAAHGAMDGEPAVAETRKANPTEQVATSDRPAAAPINTGEYQRLRQRLDEISAVHKGSLDAEEKPVGQPQSAPTTARAEEPAPSAQAATRAGEPVQEATKSEVKRTAADLMAASDVKETAYTPEQEATDREKFLSMTTRLSGEGKGIGPSGSFAKPENTSEAGSLSFAPKKEDPLTEINKRASMSDRLSTAVHSVLNPSAETQETQNILRFRTAEYAQHVEQATAAFETHVKAHDSDGDSELRTFMDAGEGKLGAQFASQGDAAAAQVLKEEFQKRWDKLAKIPGREDQGAGIENYLKHLFVGPKGQDIASRIMFGKRPLKGPATFVKHRFYEYLSDGLDNGLVPATYNPIRMQLMGLHEIDRFLMAHDMKNDMKSSGLIQFFKMGQDRPEGWQKINDQIFQPRVKIPGGLVEYGNYYAPKDAARVFNNYLSPGLRGNLGYDLVRNYGNFLNQVQLGFSYFHATVSSINSGVNDVGLALMKLSKGNIGGVKELVRGAMIPWSARSNYKLGKMLEQEYVNSGEHPELARMVTAFKQGGGKIGMDPMYENRAIESFRRQLKSNPVSLMTPIHGVEALAEKFSRPLMKYYVPRLKLGAFANLAEHKLGELMKSGASRGEIQTAMGQIWDSIDNRMGQFTYDNLFWDKRYKDAALLGVRSFGWTFGSMREAGGAVVDTGRQLNSLRKGQGAELTPRMAYALALPMVTGMIGALYGTLHGHPPKNLEDSFFPQTGGLDSSGKPERISIPGYMRDVYAFKRAPAETIVHKTSPLLGQLTDLYQNHDFYNTEIRDTNDPLWKQGLEAAKYMGKSFEPFGIQGTLRRRQSGESWLSSLGGEMGFIPAPHYIGQSKAEEVAADLSQRHMEQGPFPAGTQDARKNFYNVRNQFHAGKLQVKDLVTMVRSGQLTPKQAGSIVEQRGQPPLVRHFETKGMSWDERFKIWDASTPEEQAELKPYLIRHVQSVQNLLPDQREGVMSRLRSIFIKK